MTKLQLDARVAELESWRRRLLARVRLLKTAHRNELVGSQRRKSFYARTMEAVNIHNQITDRLFDLRGPVGEDVP